MNDVMFTSVTIASQLNLQNFNTWEQLKRCSKSVLNLKHLTSVGNNEKHSTLSHRLRGIAVEVILYDDLYHLIRAMSITKL